MENRSTIRPVGAKRAKRFKQDNTNGCREVQGTDVACDGNVINGARIIVQNGQGKPFGFRPEYEKHSFHHRHGPQGFGSVFAEKEDFVGFRGHGIDEGLKIRPDVQIDILPVIQTGASNPSTIQRKAKRFDKMQRRSGAKTGSADISRIPVDVG